MKKFHVVVALKDNLRARLADQLRAFLKDAGMKETSLEESEVVFSIGGDGTILHVASRIVELFPENALVCGASPLIFGINAGKLGFLTASDSASWKEDIEKFLRSEYEEERRYLLEARCGGQTFHSLNEIAVMRKGARILGVKVFLDGDEMAYFKGDGFIVATPTGSTAYSLAAGGPIVEPHTRVMVCTPVCPHTLSARPVVVSENHLIQISLDGDAYISSDGKTVCELTPEEFIEISTSKIFVRLVNFGRSFFATLEEKMDWKRG